MLRVASHNLPHTWPLEFFRSWVGPSSQERRPRLEVAGVCVTFCGPRLLQSLLMRAEAALIAAGLTERTQRAELTDEAVTSMFMSQIAMISK